MLDRNHYSYIVPGYSGHIPANILEEAEERMPQKKTAHIPGYQGYVKSIKSENLFAKTFGKITDKIAHDDYHIGADVEPMERYTSLNREAFSDLSKIHDKKIAQVVGVNPVPEVYNAPIPKDVMESFFGQDKEGGKEGGEKSSEKKDVCCEDVDVDCQVVMKIGEPIPGYTGMNRRMVADNVFGLTYANARKKSRHSQCTVAKERGENLSCVSNQIPPLRK